MGFFSEIAPRPRDPGALLPRRERHVLRLVTSICRLAQQRRRAALAVLILLGLLGGLGGANLWASHHLQAARQELQARNYARARDHINRCLRIWWFRGEVHLLAARIERLNENFVAAEDHLKECQRRITPVTEPMQLEWLLLRAQRGEVDEVGSGLMYVVLKAHHPESSMILETLVRGYIRQRRFQDAFFCAEVMLTRDKDNVFALYWRGFINEEVRNLIDARRDYGRVVELDPGQDDARLRLAALLLDSSRPLEALPHLELLSQSKPDNLDVQLGLARCRQIQYKLPEARSMLQRVLAASPENIRGLYYLGIQDLIEGKLAAAEASFRHVLRIDPQYQNALRKLHTCLVQQQNRNEEAAELLDRMEKLEADSLRLDKLLNWQLERSSPQDPSVPAEIGELLLGMGKEKAGLHWLEHVALNRNPNDPHTHEILAAYYEKKKERKKAEYHRARVSQGSSPAGQAGSSGPSSGSR